MDKKSYSCLAGPLFTHLASGRLRRPIKEEVMMMYPQLFFVLVVALASQNGLARKLRDSDVDLGPGQESNELCFGGLLNLSSSD